MHPGLSHEQHMDALWRRQNARLLADVRDTGRAPLDRWLALWGLGQQEVARLKAKAAAMTAGNWGGQG
jgi:hypothetical protein